jgi:peptidyl-prolyl cis-trans isomerase A (cyclophilin A)
MVDIALSTCRVCMALALSVVASCKSTYAPEATLVEIDTELGVIEVEIDLPHAPTTSRNFLRYVDDGAYDGGFFYRATTIHNQSSNSVQIEIIQGGRGDSSTPELPPIELETTAETGLAHLAGTISMARGSPDSATSDFFICVTDQPELNFGGRRNPDGRGFAAFGRVVEGMEVVRRIQNAPADGQALSPPIQIRSVRQIRGP